MSYTTVGAAGPGAGQSVADSAIEAARPRLGDMLTLLESITGAGGDRLKILPSDNETLAGQTCGGTSCQNISQPTQWDGSNVIVWPASDYADLGRAWTVGHAYVGTKGPFALDLTNVAKALAALRALISAIDVKMRFAGLTIKTSSTNFLPFILAGVGLLGVVLLTRKSKGGKGKSRSKRSSRRQRRR